MSNLVIVESPAKSKTIKKFLGEGFLVLSSYGHVRDLPQKKLGVDIENNFEPQYEILSQSKKQIAKIKKAAKDAKAIYLATDKDREGEAIAWHLTHVLKAPKEKIKRITFDEITRQAILNAIKNPRGIDMHLVNAQQARRVLDRLVGYKLSPFLWKKVYRGLSAGRVQSAAVRLIVDREREIEKFIPQEYWEIIALLLKKGEKEAFGAKLFQKDDKIIPKLGIKDKKEAENIKKELQDAIYKVKKVEKKETVRYPLPPFTTSTLQQTAYNYLRFSAKKTMMIAQQLYEGVEIKDRGRTGLITYMRTDSQNLAKEAVSKIRATIQKEFGKEYLPPSARTYKARSRRAQEAHEAIRPTDASLLPEKIKDSLTPDQFKLYQLIWKRALACQAEVARFDSVTADIEAKNYLFRSAGLTLKFDGFLKISGAKIQETALPELQENEILDLKELNLSQKFTQAAPRYTQATLVKALEKEGIGRPSTYVPIINTILKRNYVELQKGKFHPTEVGMVVNDILVEHFPRIVDLKFTAQMEEKLDKIASGKEKWQPVIKEFYGPFEKNLKEKEKSVEKKNFEEESDEICEKCGAKMVIKRGRFGKFLACSNFPKCKNTKPLTLGVNCPKCKKGKIVERRTKKGKIFYGCSNFPKCDFALWNKPSGEKCPKCGSLLIETDKGKKCSNKECLLVSSQRKKRS